MLLITTPIEETKGTDQEVMCLSAGCIPFLPKGRPSERLYKILPYHWSNRDKRKKDFIYLHNLYERALGDLSLKLNEIHAVNYDIRYWRILVGPWLLYFTEIFWDRWCSINQAVLEKDVTNTIALSLAIEDMVPVDMVGFTKYMTSDLWNHVIYSYIIENYTDIDVSKIQYKVNKYEPSASKQISFLKRIKTISYDFIYKTICSLFGDDNVFILNSYLPEKVLSLLQFKLRQFPINYRSAAFNNCDIKMSERNWGVSGNIQDPFDKALRRVIPLQIPLAYIEGYSRLVKQAYSVKWPKNPKLIFTSNNHYYDDLFKSWAAEKVYSGVPLVIGTHGSGPDFEYSSATIHELSISDYHLGPVVFEKYVHKSILHAHNFTPFIKYDKHGGGLLVELCIPKYSFALSSTPLSCEFIEYLDGQFQFYDFLPFHIRKQFIVRNYHNSYGWDVLDRWMDRYPNVNIDSGATMFRSMVAKSRIVVSSYMGSNYSDLIGSSIPTVSFWNPSLFQVHNGAYDMFSEMKRVGIHHVTPESAAAHISGIWNDVDAWWNSEDVIIVRKQFCSRYAHTAHNLASLISGPFRNILAGQEKCEL